MRITVTGVSQLRLPAECVVVTLTTGFTGPRRDEVVAETARTTDGLRARLQEAIADGRGRDLKLTSLRTWAGAGTDSQGNPGTPQHSAEVRGSVRLDDLSVVGPLLGELAATRGVRVVGLDWQLTEETIAQQQPEVIGEAFRDARQRAGWIASAAGYRRIEPTSIRDDGAPMFARAMSAPMQRGGSAPQIDLDPADVEVSAHLTVDFETT
ncbi:SIMPL domain-containing protein [Tessaracoccus lacteus]|uniref:SIMPL domain-containing protein n=1 Tax=Tessaracoccus lacteus TaxID=3041766 RepID=A0ABY8PXJ5_9ACTN|nr:SIMPL domain-containing protein [Tessaracoccus sp. T21]WGT47235.1 SIMPL domain-containing protein [Tessaracoccus sp. T21]